MRSVKDGVNVGKRGRRMEREGESGCWREGNTKVKGSERMLEVGREGWREDGNDGEYPRAAEEEG